jgi:hypothetical protein
VNRGIKESWGEDRWLLEFAEKSAAVLGQHRASIGEYKDSYNKRKFRVMDWKIGDPKFLTAVLATRYDSSSLQNLDIEQKPKGKSGGDDQQYSR